MFLSQFSMLKSLGYGDDSAIKEETDKILAPYKIFVLVLHDPRAHITFHERFSEIFEKLSEHNRNCYKCRYLYDESRWYTDGYYCRCKEAINHSKESIDADKKLIKSLSYNSGV